MYDAEDNTDGHENRCQVMLILHVQYGELIPEHSYNKYDAIQVYRCCKLIK